MSYFIEDIHELSAHSVNRKELIGKRIDNAYLHPSFVNGYFEVEGNLPSGSHFFSRAVKLRWEDQ